MIEKNKLVKKDLKEMQEIYIRFTEKGVNVPFLA